MHFLYSSNEGSWKILHLVEDELVYQKPILAIFRVHLLYSIRHKQLGFINWTSPCSPLHEEDELTYQRPINSNWDSSLGFKLAKKTMRLTKTQIKKHSNSSEINKSLQIGLNLRLNFNSQSSKQHNTLVGCQNHQNLYKKISYHLTTIEMQSKMTTN